MPRAGADRARAGSRLGGTPAPERRPGGPCPFSCGPRERPRRSTSSGRPRPPRCRSRWREGAGTRPRADGLVSPRPTTATGPRCRRGGRPGPAVPSASESARRSRGVLLRRCGARCAFPGIGRPVGQLAGSLVHDDERVTTFDDEEGAARYLPASAQGRHRAVLPPSDQISGQLGSAGVSMQDPPCQNFDIEERYPAETPAILETRGAREAPSSGRNGAGDGSAGRRAPGTHRVKIQHLHRFVPHCERVDIVAREVGHQVVREAQRREHRHDGPARGTRGSRERTPRFAGSPRTPAHPGNGARTWSR